jgi:hypothetical protein
VDASVALQLQYKLTILTCSIFLMLATAAVMSCRRVGRQSSPLHSAGARAAAASRRQQAPLAPSRGGSKDLHGGLSTASSSSGRPGTGSAAAAAAAAADVQASRVNRTLLMELMHEDDVSGRVLWPAAATAARIPMEMNRG